ncbi:glycosyltransferase [Pasteurella multocida]|uniref:Chondroitin synthase n=4 Tax=Pasteurella multocida TaxID=747 RepID=CHS_PASMU|nr:glycosyltransferase [Pasteurella multocida]Q9CMP0.1 RecName: Full=Chondroitin synthase; Short=CS; Includes: RecName: Full=Glucuronosyl-N-acetylgalactosaminyl-proteoglycan 4-beta-N-acetylgalactosaminyltransferase; AltName: Full=UDP-GalNAc transferase; Includes: RecName: Full=N-acetylgalactosaminyl-proteoglycan 3-beta-glucuronosyltransferase; AltName: Full=UDP-GlcUA transferase [Pasteurella multocida subsp. multocida str. Pm70]AAK02859.1 unknown [Pasteurella multocida subsp. multocida str. Pm70]
MNTLSQAIKAYNSNDYELALKLFEKSAETYGRKIVEFQIIKCKEKLSTNSYVSEDKKNSVCDSSLDIATQLLLSNVKKLTLSESEKNSLKNKWKSITGKKSENAEIRKVELVPKDFPKDLVLAPLPDHVNDFTWYKNRKKSLGIKPVNKNIGLSIIIPTFNRSRILDITLACLVNQKTNYPFEVVVADDGSKENLLTIVQKYEQKLDIKYVRQKDYGYQLCAVRNLGLRTAKYDFVSILDCDMAPQQLWVHSYLTELLEDNDIVLIGPRKYVDTHNITAEQFLNDPYLIESLPETATNNNPSITSKGNISLDWRLEHFKKTDNLRLCDSPFRYFSCGNVAFSKEWLNKVGWFDEEFNHWGGEDVEFGYRLFAKGCFFRVIDGGMAYHQEPPGKENETDREAGKSITLKIVKEKVPYIYRKLLPIEDSHIHRIPLVSIYIPAYNCANYIQRCVDSALNQTVVDLEVCICNDGSTDNTLEVINKLYGNNPRVRIMSKPNGGIASASNAAVSFAKGYYIGQLDSDDYLEPDAVELCLKEFLKDKTLACVYTTNRNVNPDGSLIANGYNWPEFSREKLTTAMIAHHFRMFTIRAWHLTDGFNEKIENAVDYDMFLKLSEVGKFKHLNKICYNRVLHGDNTSIKNLDTQKKNHFVVVNQSLNRQRVSNYNYDEFDNLDESRKYIFNKTADYQEEIDILKDIKIVQRKDAKVAISIFYPNRLDGLVKKLNNIIEYNKNVLIIVLHIDKNHLTSDIKKEILEFHNKNQINILLNNDVSYYTNNRLIKTKAHLSNMNKLRQLNLNLEYIIFDNHDSLFIKNDSYNHIKKYDIGMNFSSLTNDWINKINAHSPFKNLIKKYFNDNDLKTINMKGASQGMFIKYTLAHDIATIMKEVITLCQSTDSVPEYNTEDIWFQFALLILEKKTGHVFNKTSTLTYMPWERKLQWTNEQIESAKRGENIPVNKFIINSITL